MPTGPTPFSLGDVVRLRKPHPCGSQEWTVVRLGADIGLRCHGCQHRVMLTRRDLERRLKAFVSRATDDATIAGEGETPGAGAGSDRAVHVVPLPRDRDHPAPG
ncbi:MAG: protein of unknown function DUF951 [uncultured Thermomicrobiales bacterium]|uniref:DUF951 domain-containing protein n=1 Tax=uncultured Thermomicrobiales bacterium TaxID=1645740 RepID=A0A6J4UG64_9BACT|nr:MAG: protein of unknown function DUF951 [uncultured Thermomicrobiales bacterium]